MKTKDKILYLDDEQQHLDMFYVLFKHKYHVFVTPNYKEALNILENNKIKVVLTDQKMPEITGIEFIKYVNQYYQDIVCFIVTGFTNKDILFRALNDVHVFGFIEKPWKPNELILSIDNAIEKYDSEKEKEKINHELEIALIKAKESDRLKTEFLGSISHEIRTPLNAIVGFSGIIKEIISENKTAGNYLENIENASFRLTTLIDDMITASHLHAGTMEMKKDNLYLNDLLDDLYHNFSSKVRAKQNIEFRVLKRQRGNNISIKTDKEKLNNIFTQLLDNALKFTKTGIIEFGVFNEEKQILFVKDTGCGISESDKPLIYDFFCKGNHKYLSAEIEGVGLGLSVVKGFIKLMGGKVWIETEQGKGTIFYFTISRS